MILDPLIAPSLLILAAGAACPMPPATAINVVPVSDPIIYDYSKGLRELQHEHVDTINPYDFGSDVRTQGLMSGSLQIAPEIKIGYQVMRGANAACLWYDSVNISLKLAPTIKLGREVYHDPCMKRAVLEHEMKHVAVDRAIVNKYSRSMGQRIYAALQERGFSTGPVAGAQAEALAAQMQQTVFQLIEHEFKKLELERAEAQQAVDTRQEYDRVSALCPDFQRKYTVRRAYGETR